LIDAVAVTLTAAPLPPREPARPLLPDHAARHELAGLNDQRLRGRETGRSPVTSTWIGPSKLSSRCATTRTLSARRRDVRLVGFQCHLEVGLTRRIDSVYLKSGPAATDVAEADKVFAIGRRREEQRESVPVRDAIRRRSRCKP